MLAHLARRARSGVPGLSSSLRPPLPCLLANQFSSTAGTAAPSPRRLGDILRLDLLKDKTGPEIEAIWRQFHDAAQNKDATHRFRLGTVLPAADYKTFAARAAASPLFVLPVAKQTQAAAEGGEASRGLLTLVTQAQLPHVLVGTLEEYKGASGPGAAPAHAVITHYDELAEDKGVVLVRTDLISPHVLSVEEGRAAVAALHSLYLGEEGHALVKAFNHAPASFQWEALLEHLGLSGVGGSGGEGGGGG